MPASMGANIRSGSHDPMLPRMYAIAAAVNRCFLSTTDGCVADVVGRAVSATSSSSEDMPTLASGVVREESAYQLAPVSFSAATNPVCSRIEKLQAC